MNPEKSQHMEKSHFQSVSGDALLLTVSILTGFLPLILVTSVALFFPWDHLQPTLSEYVYTSANPFFVGIVFSLGLVLLYYRGYDTNDGLINLSDRQLTSLAGLGCMVTAIFPSNTCTALSGEEMNAFRSLFWGYVHILGALLAYFPMALFILFNFTQTGGASFDQLTLRKIWSNRIYRVCGSVVLACLVFIIGRKVFMTMNGISPCGYYQQPGPTFYAETLMQSAVSVAWLTKFAGRRLKHCREPIPDEL